MKTPIETIETICALFGTTYQQLKQRNRQDAIVEARQIAMYIILCNFPLTLEKAGALVEKNHATVIHARKRVLNAINDPRVDPRIYNAIAKIREKHPEINTTYCAKNSTIVINNVQ